MKMYVSGKWVESNGTINVVNPYDGQIIDTVPKGNSEDVDKSITSAVRGSEVMAALPGYRRFEILRKTADLLEERIEEFAKIITQEEGKTINEARGEVQRAVQTISLSGEEAKRLYGETIPLDGAPTWTGQFGFTIRIPVGVVAAISPFNFPLNLVAHKVGPALAAGNSVIVKPATDTPLSALKLTEILLESGLPEEGIQCITGTGSSIGDSLVSDNRIRKITFTGSQEVGEHICKVAFL